jgi:hypothetical protein
MTILSSTPRYCKVLSLRLKNFHFLYALPISTIVIWSHYDDDGDDDDDDDMIKSEHVSQKSRSHLIILGLRRLA